MTIRILLTMCAIALTISLYEATPSQAEEGRVLGDTAIARVRHAIAVAIREALKREHPQGALVAVVTPTVPVIGACAHGQVRHAITIDITQRGDGRAK